MTNRCDGHIKISLDDLVYVNYLKIERNESRFLVGGKK
jgi:hypothetical protein